MESKSEPLVKTSLTLFISLVWVVNGLFCKVLNMVPRHREIVSRILGPEYSGFATIGIGFSEIFMAVWILSRIKSRWCTFTQIFVVALMNIIEFIKVPDLLLFGKMNSIVAFIFIMLLFYNEYAFAEVNGKKTVLNN